MRYPQQSWQPSPQPWPQHSTEIEHRLTVVETVLDHETEARETQDAKLQSQDRRLNLHEKAILGIIAVLQILMQERYPKLAELLKSLM